MIVFAAVGPALLRIMERIEPKDEDVQYLINLFERNGFNFAQFKKKAEQIFNENPDASHDEIEKEGSSAISFALRSHPPNQELGLYQS